MTKERVLREGIVEALRQIGELSDQYADDSVSEHFRHLNAHLTGTLMEADSVAEPKADHDCPAVGMDVNVRGVCPTCDALLAGEPDARYERAMNLLRRYLDREFNPFEPNNQSSTYKELSEFLYPTSRQNREGSRK